MIKFSFLFSFSLTSSWWVVVCSRGKKEEEEENLPSFFFIQSLEAAAWSKRERGRTLGRRNLTKAPFYLGLARCNKVLSTAKRTDAERADKSGPKRTHARITLGGKLRTSHSDHDAHSEGERERVQPITDTTHRARETIFSPSVSKTHCFDPPRK